MIPAAVLIPDWLNLLLAAIMLIALSLAARFADWRAIVEVPARLHLLFASTGFCLLLWFMRIELGGAVEIHLLAHAPEVVMVISEFMICLSNAMSKSLMSGESVIRVLLLHGTLVTRTVG